MVECLSGWEYTATTSYDFLRLPITPSVSCSCRDSSNTRSPILSLPPSVSLHLPTSTTSSKFTFRPPSKEILEEERAAIPMGGQDPIVPQRTVGVGSCASHIHPASGYMVARALEMVPDIAAAVAPKLKSLRSKVDSGQPLTAAELESVSEAGWEANWPADMRRQRDFMSFGMELLCILSPQELRDFFTGFFRLPDRLWENFLSWRLSGIGNVLMGLTVWASCIPRRFVPTMLVKSLPFILSHLFLPFVSRGAPLKLDSPYTEDRWGPAEYDAFEKSEAMRKWWIPVSSQFRRLTSMSAFQASPTTHHPPPQPSATSSSISPSEGQEATGVVAAGEAAAGGAESEVEAKGGAAAEGVVV